MAGSAADRAADIPTAAEERRGSGGGTPPDQTPSPGWPRIRTGARLHSGFPLDKACPPPACPPRTIEIEQLPGEGQGPAGGAPRPRVLLGGVAGPTGGGANWEAPP